MPVENRFAIVVIAGDNTFGVERRSLKAQIPTAFDEQTGSAELEQLKIDKLKPVHGRGRFYRRAECGLPVGL